MMDNRRPVPLYQPATLRAVCPVCSTTSYSPSGIHPQCAQIQADAQRMKRVKATKKPAAPKGRNPLALTAWHKRCPRCRAEVHIRKVTCQCGHQFEAKRAE